MNNPLRTHDRSHFYKYSTLSTAMKILNSHSFQWSSPLKFNDPFDCQTPLTGEIDEDEFAHELCEAFIKVVYTDTPLDTKFDVGLFQDLNNLRANRDDIDKKKLIQRITKSSLISANLLKSSRDKFNDEIVKIASHASIFCVSEIIDNIVMWSHYADQHRGVAFRLGCIDELDNLLLKAKKIQYVDTFPKFPTTKEYANHLTGLKTVDQLAIAKNIPFIKHKDWKYEKEWRVWYPLLDASAGTGVDYRIENIRIFEELYLGCNINKDDADKIIYLARRKFPDMKIYQAKCSNKRYGLDFEFIS
jgi:Protein of unknown function (DUF2971)